MKNKRNIIKKLVLKLVNLQIYKFPFCLNYFELLNLQRFVYHLSNSNKKNKFLRFFPKSRPKHPAKTDFLK